MRAGKVLFVMVAVLAMAGAAGAQEYVPLFDASGVLESGKAVDINNRWAFDDATVTVYCQLEGTAYVVTDDGEGTYSNPIVDNYITAGNDSFSICTGGVDLPDPIAGTNCFNSAAGTRPLGTPLENLYNSIASAPVNLTAGENTITFKLWDWGSSYGNTKLVLELPDGCSATPPGCETDLIAGGGGDGGETVGSVVTVDNFDNTWAVTYNTNQDWELTELHLHLACDPENLPQNKSHNPTIGHFAYTAYPEPGTHTFTFPDDVEGLEEVFPLVGDFKEGFFEDSCTCVYFAAHSVVANTAYCDQFTTFYGAEQYSGDLYSIDLNGGTATLLAEIDGGLYGNENYPNGVAWDAVNSRLYFTSEKGGLFFWNGTTVIPSGSLGGTVAGGTFYDGSFYYVLNGTDDLYQVTFDADGLVEANDMICGEFAGNTTMQFGDVVVDPAGPTLLGSADIFNRTPRPAFFSVALDGTCVYEAWTQPEKLQLAFGADGVLYGQATGSGSFYSLDLTNGDPTYIGEVPTGADDAVFHFTDLASDTRCVPPTETAWGDGTDFGGRSWATYFSCGCEE